VATDLSLEAPSPAASAVSRRSPAALLRLLWASPFAYLALFLVAPMVLVALMSTWSVNNTYHIVHHSSLTNYRTAFGDGVYRALFFKSLEVAALVTVVTLLVALPLAYYIATMRSARLRRVLFGFVVIPSGTSFLIRTYSWITVLGQGGVLRWSLSDLGVAHPPQLLFTQWAVVISLSYTYLTFMFLPLYASFVKLDRSLLESAHNLGASPAFRFLRITLPLAKPALAAGFLLVFVPSLGEYATPALLGGANGELYGNVIQTWVLQLDFPLAAALSVVLLVVVVGSIALIGRWIGLTRVWTEW